MTKTKPIARRRRIFVQIYFNLAFFTWIWVRYGSLNGVGVTPPLPGFIAVLAKRRELIFGPKFPETSYFPEEWHVC